MSHHSKLIEYCVAQGIMPNISVGRSRANLLSIYDDMVEKSTDPPNAEDREFFEFHIFSNKPDAWGYEISDEQLHVHLLEAEDAHPLSWTQLCKYCELGYIADCTSSIFLNLHLVDSSGKLYSTITEEKMIWFDSAIDIVGKQFPDGIPEPVRRLMTSALKHHTPDILERMRDLEVIS